MMIAMDDPDHKRLRNLVTRAFNQKAAEALRPRIREISESILDSITENEFDFAARFAAPFAITVISEIMGFTNKLDQAHVNEWSDMFMKAIFSVNPSPEQAAEGKVVEGKLSVSGCVVHVSCRVSIDAATTSCPRRRASATVAEVRAVGP